MNEHSPGRTGPVKQILLLIMAVTICLYVGKIFLRSPEHRAEEACYLPYLLVEFVIVQAWGAVISNDPVTYLKHARYAADFHASCLGFTQQLGFLQHLSKNDAHEQ